jgi:hypothetical protein
MRWPAAAHSRAGNLEARKGLGFFARAQTAIRQQDPACGDGACVFCARGLSRKRSVARKKEKLSSDLTNPSKLGEITTIEHPSVHKCR